MSTKPETRNRKPRRAQRKPRCSWEERVSSGSFYAQRNCFSRAQFIVAKDGVKVGQVCYEHAPRAHRNNWDIKPL